MLKRLDLARGADQVRDRMRVAFDDKGEIELKWRETLPARLLTCAVLAACSAVSGAR